MKTALGIVLLTLAIAATGFAQTPAAAPAAAPAAIPVTAAESAAITAASAAYAAAQAAEAAPVKALLASPEQQALPAATVTALNQLKGALDSSAASHAIDQNQYGYSASGGWVKGQNHGQQGRVSQ